MEAINVAITVNMTLTLDGDKAALSIKGVDLKPAMITLPMRSGKATLEPVKKQKTYHQIILEVAQDFVEQTREKVFTAAVLYNRAKQKYPDIKRSSFNNRVMAAAPQHSSYKHLLGTKDFLKYLGDGKYELKGGR